MRFKSDHDILQRVIQRMAQVKRSGDVRRRNDDRERFAIVGLGVKVARVLPHLVETRLCGLEVKAVRKFFCCDRFHGFFAIDMRYPARGNALKRNSPRISVRL